MFTLSVCVWLGVLNLSHRHCSIIELNLILTIILEPRLLDLVCFVMGFVCWYSSFFFFFL